MKKNHSPLRTTVCPLPHATCTTPLDLRASTKTGLSWSFVSPRPSCPSSPLPQEYTVEWYHRRFGWFRGGGFGRYGKRVSFGYGKKTYDARTLMGGGKS